MLFWEAVYGLSVTMRNGNKMRLIVAPISSKQRHCKNKHSPNMMVQKKPGLSNIQRSRLVAQGNALIKERGNELKDFTDCANQANRHGAGIDDPSCPLPNLYHLRLYKEPWLDDKTLLQKLVKAKAKFQSNQLGRGKPIAFDEYSIDIVRMPYGLKPERLLQLLASDLNGTLIGGNAGDLFSRVNYFKRREKGLPQLGELVDIRIPGDPSLHNIMSDDGTVQLVELTSDRFTYQTVTTPETGAHPENGARTFGFRRLGNSTVRFYTYGASRPNNESLQLPGWAAQETGWRSLVTAIGELVNRLGGEADFGRTRANRFNQKCD